MSLPSGRRPGPIIPPQTGSLRSLTVTMTVMCYLACLAIGALILINRAVDNWTSGLSREITVQIRELQNADIEAEVAKATEILKGTAGVVDVQVLSKDEGAKLLEPWLGSHDLGDLPIPRLIRVVIDEGNPPDFAALEEELTAQVKGVAVDTHRRWQTELTRMARILSILSSAILVLICVSAVTTVIFGTRTVLEANREVVDVLHLVGAKDSYIARQIDSRFLRTGLQAGLLGVALGVVTFLLLGSSGSPAGGGISDASRSLLFAPPGFAVWNYGLLLSVPLVATLIALITSRLTLIRMLRGVL